MQRHKSDIDGGWALVIVLASLIAQILIFGICYSSAILYLTFLDHFHLSASTTAWVVTLNTCCTYMFGPVGSLLFRHVGARLSIAGGCVLSTLGLIATGFAPDLRLCFLTFGLVTGLGWSLVCVCLHARTAEYFHRFRRMALATTSTGIALGQLVYPPLLTALFETFSWSGGFLLLAGLNLNLFVVAAAMMPARGAAQVRMERTRRGSRLQRAVRAAGEDLPLLKNVYFLFLIGSTLVSGLAVSAFLTHISNAALHAGHSTVEASMLASVIGVASLVGRLILGIVAQHPRVSVTLVNMISFACIGVAGLTLAFLRAYSAFLACSVLFGFFSGVWGLLPELVIVVVGLGNLSGGLGALNFFSAIGLLCGGPFAALLFESDPSYRLSFVLSGVLSVVSSLLLVPNALSLRRKRRGSTGRNALVAENEMKAISQRAEEEEEPS